MKAAPQAGQRWAGHITSLAPSSSPEFLRSFPAWEYTSFYSNTKTEGHINTAKPLLLQTTEKGNLGICVRKKEVIPNPEIKVVLFLAGSYFTLL